MKQNALCMHGFTQRETYLRETLSVEVVEIEPEDPDYEEEFLYKNSEGDTFKIVKLLDFIEDEVWDIIWVSPYGTEETPLPFRVNSMAKALEWIWNLLAEAYVEPQIRGVRNYN